jgi:Tol biopolymer transport system component
VSRRVIVLAFAALLIVFALPAPAAEPPGPRLAISVSGGKAAGVITIGPSGEQLKVLVEDPDYKGIGDRLSWSADGNRLAFGVSGVRGTASESRGAEWPVVGVAEADGGTTRVFPRAFLNAGDPVMAPDGRSVVFQRMKFIKTSDGEGYDAKSSIWLLDVEARSVRRLTPWRFAYLDLISYSPDGSALVAVLFDYRGHRIVTVDLHSYRIRPLAPLGPEDFQQTYSPDGSRLAFVRTKFLHRRKLLAVRPISELLVARADGSGAKRLLRRKGYISFPSWDPSGSRLAFTRDPAAKGTGLREPEPGNKVMAINADGTCLTRVFTDPEVTVYGSAWQPGVGREAGPISC